MDASGRRLAKARLPEGVAGITRLHAMIGAQLGDDTEDVAAQVKIGIETDRGPWVQALIAAGYMVYAVNPLQAARYRERLALSVSLADHPRPTTRQDSGVGPPPKFHSDRDMLPARRAAVNTTVVTALEVNARYGACARTNTV